MKLGTSDTHSDCLIGICVSGERELGMTLFNIIDFLHVVPLLGF